MSADLPRALGAQFADVEAGGWGCIGFMSERRVSGLRGVSLLLPHAIPHPLPWPPPGAGGSLTDGRSLPPSYRWGS